MHLGAAPFRFNIMLEAGGVQIFTDHGYYAGGLPYCGAGLLVEEFEQFFFIYG